MDDEDPVHHGTRHKLERLGVQPTDEVWLLHYVQCVGFLGREREPLTALLPLVDRALRAQAGGSLDPGRAPIPSHFFALAVVKRDGRFLLVRELDGGWYLPAGRIHAGEPIHHGARREVLEESGVHVEVTGLLRVEHAPGEHTSRVRVFVVAEALGGAVPRATPNEHSQEARWLTLDEIRALPLRSPEVLEVLRAAERPGAVLPWVWSAPGAAW